MKKVKVFKPLIKDGKVNDDSKTNQAMYDKLEADFLKWQKKNKKD